MASQEEKKFGLPNIESFEPIKHKNKPVRVVFSILLLLTLGGAVYWFYFREGHISKLETSIGLENNHENSTEVTSNKDQIIVENFESKPKVGEITLVNEKTGKHYIVIGSFIDEDLAIDYAKKLIKKDIGVYIINSIKKNRYTYVAVDAADNLDDAKQLVSTLSSRYHKKAWVVSY